MQQHANKTSFELPKGYGPLAETFQVVGPAGVEGTLFVHDRDGDKPGQVASLRLVVGGVRMTYKHLWEPKTPHTSRAGNVLQFRNAPNSDRGESWNSRSFRERRVEVFESPQHEVFAMVPNGEPHADDPMQDRRIAVKLRRREARDSRPREAFDVAHFQARAQQAKEAVQGRQPAPKASAAPATEPAKDVAAEARKGALDVACLEAVQQNEGTKGARWDDVLGVLQHRSWPDGKAPSDDEAEASLNRLMDKGVVYEPTLGILKTA